jgi:NDP-4-keto-2,6-dideoxyhexose 3-C-methyltransferase
LKPIESILDFGALRVSCFPRGDEQVASSPLDFCRCELCGLVQLRHTYAPDKMFRQYWYRSGVNETMRAELADVVADGIRHVDLVDGAVVIDVGANDGTLLAEYDRQASDVYITRIAYEPAKNLQPELRLHCEVLNFGYFPNKSQLRDSSVSLITSIACFYAVDDPLAFVQAVDNLLTREGVWIVQFQDLCQMLQATAFDDICHEHLFYPSLASVERMLDPFDLMIFDAKRREINGGSLRLAIGRRYREETSRVSALRIKELGCESRDTLTSFACRVGKTRELIRMAVLNEVSAGHIVDLYGASTKGNILLQVCDFGPDVIRQAWERSEAKWGCLTVTGIPIVSEQAGRNDPPDVLFVGIWQFREAVLRREKDFEGQFLFPLPTVGVVRRDMSRVTA